MAFNLGSEMLVGKVMLKVLLCRKENKLLLGSRGFLNISACAEQTTLHKMRGKTWQMIMSSIFISTTKPLFSSVCGGGGEVLLLTFTALRAAFQAR